MLKGHLAWINGGFPAGYWPDVEIFRDGLGSWLSTNECIEANDRYIREARMKVKCPASVPNRLDCAAMQSIVQMRHETINKRLKQWSALAEVYHHDMQTHCFVFRAIAVLTQLSILNGEPLFDVGYRDPE